MEGVDNLRQVNIFSRFSLFKPSETVKPKILDFIKFI